MTKTDHRHSQVKIDRDEIVRRAYQLWDAAGRPAGRDLEFSLQAEAELLAAASGRASKPATFVKDAKRKSAGSPAALKKRLQAEKPQHGKAASTDVAKS